MNVVNALIILAAASKGVWGGNIQSIVPLELRQQLDAPWDKPKRRRKFKPSHKKARK